MDQQVQLGRMALRDTLVLLEPPVLLDQLDPQVQVVLPDSQEPQVRLENLEFLVQLDFLGHLEPLVSKAKALHINFNLNNCHFELLFIYLFNKFHVLVSISLVAMYSC